MIVSSKMFRRDQFGIYISVALRLAFPKHDLSVWIRLDREVVVDVLRTRTVAVELHVIMKYHVREYCLQLVCSKEPAGTVAHRREYNGCAVEH